MPTPISTLDSAYTTGGLSVFPAAIDSWSTLYQAANNATSTLRQTLPYNGKQIILDDGSSFPPQGIIRIGPKEGQVGKVVTPDTGSTIVNGNTIQAGNAELVVYTKKNGNVLSGLYRAFAGSTQSQFPAGAYVINGVMAEHHNAIKDAILRIEADLGKLSFPDPNSLNGILTSLERRFLSPKPIFRAFPLVGAPPLRVRFQNFSGGDPIHYLWDFGDGTTSSEQSPIHTYAKNGVYSVKLNVITTLGAQGIAAKSNYITVSQDNGVAFFYTDNLMGVSTLTANLPNSTDEATTFTFVDQSEGDIVERIWDFGDGNRTTIDDPDIHTIEYVYPKPGTYDPTLLVVFDTQQFKRVFLYDKIQVT